MPDLEPSLDAPSAPTVSPFELLSVLWRRRLVVIATVVVSVLIALALSVRSPKQYSASAQLLSYEAAFGLAEDADAERARGLLSLAHVSGQPEKNRHGDPEAARSPEAEAVHPSHRYPDTNWW